MREINLPIETAKIKINGMVFELHMSDLDIYNRAQEIHQKFQKYNERPTDSFPPEEVLADCNELAGFLDSMLGEGAVARISKGKPVRMAMLFRWIDVIAEDAASHYAELIEGEHD